MSPSAAAPNSASVIAWQSASASEWPARPCVCAISTPPRMSFLPSTSACVSQPSPTRQSGPRGSACARSPAPAPAQSSASAMAKSSGCVTLMFSAEPATSFGLQADRLDRRGLVGRLGAARQRVGENAEAEHLRRLRLPDVVARQRRDGAIAFGPLERVGDRQREQAADAVVAAGLDERLDPFGANQATRRVVDEHPVVGGRAEPGELGEAAGDGGAARRAAAAREREARIDRQAGQAFVVLIVGRRRRRGSGSAAAPPRAPPACGRRAAGRRPRRTAWRSAAPARTPLPAHGTSAYRRRTLAGGVGIGARSIDRGGPKDKPQAPRRRGAPPKIVALLSRGTRLPAAFMLLPDIAPGKRFALPRPPGSADALLLARFAEKERARGKLARDLQRRARRRAAPRRRDPVLRAAPARRRLPRLGDAALRHLLAARGPDLRAPGDALADPARRRRRRPDAGDDGAGAARAAELHRRLHLPLHDQAAPRRGGAQGAAHARRLHAT